MATMRDVARLAGVSSATVSAYVTNKGWVSPALSNKVRKAMEALDYHPDHVARSLRVGRTRVIGMIVPDVANIFYMEIMRGVEEVAKQAGYFVILCDSNEDPAQEEAYFSGLRSQRVDGVLLASAASDAAYDRPTRRQFAIVFIDAIPAGITEGVVTVDNYGAAYKATHYLIDLGHRRIAIVIGNLNRSVAVDRLEGFRAAMGEASLPVPEQYFQRGDSHMENGYQAGLHLMRLATPPTAVFACSNTRTLGLMRALTELKVPCPEQVSVVSFDDADWATSFRPTVTCVAQPTYALGRRAAELLLRKIVHPGEGTPDPSQPAIVSLEAELRVRESCGPPPADSCPGLRQPEGRA